MKRPINFFPRCPLVNWIMVEIRTITKDMSIPPLGHKTKRIQILDSSLKESCNTSLDLSVGDNQEGLYSKRKRKLIVEIPDNGEYQETESMHIR